MRTSWGVRQQSANGIHFSRYVMNAFHCICRGVLLGTFLSASGGCAEAPRVERVMGMVNLDGRPLDGAQVVLWPRDPVMGVALRLSDADGQFDVIPDPEREKLQPSEYLVLVEKIVKLGGSSAEEIPRKLGSRKPLPAGQHHVVPPRYSDRRSPIIVVELHFGENDLGTLALTSAP